MASLHLLRASSRAALALLVLGGCTDAERSPTESTPAALFSCLFGPAREMEVGEVARFAGEAAQTLCLGGGGFRGPSPEPTAARIAAADSMGQDEQWHVDLRLREKRELEPLFPAARAAAPPAVFSARAAVEPQAGDLLHLNTTTECERIDRAVGRVEAITRTAIVVADTSNPPGGFTEGDWRFFGEAFDTLVNPVDVRNFGEPTDIDENDRVIIFFTEAVNELTPPGAASFVGGFFWAGDLFPNEDLAGLLAALLLGSTSTAAQECVGRMLAADGRAVVASGALARYDLVGTVEGTDLGGAYWANPAGALGYSLGYTWRGMAEGPADLHVARAGVLLEAARIPRLRVCLRVDAYGAWLAGAGEGTDYESYAFPIGLGVALPFRLHPELPAALYLGPSLVLVRSRGTVPGIGVEESYAAPRVEAGFGGGWGPLLARLGISVTRTPEETGVASVPDLRAGLEVGIRF